MAQQTAADKQAAKNGTGRKRYVRTDAGSRRYKVPIGAEIGSARNAKAAEAQKDTGARNRYEQLVGGDAKAQAEQLRGLNDADLDKLADVAFSFKSSDPNVVRLRISARNEQARRGRKIKPGQTESNPGKPAAPRGRVGSARTNLAHSRATQILLAANEGTRVTRLSIKEDQEGNTWKAKGMGSGKPPGKPEREKLAAKGKATQSGSFPIRNVADLRKAIQAFGRAKPQTRGAVARLIVRRARELNASHLVGSGIARAAGKPAAELAAEHTQAVELAGKWKHGYIPLDAVAVREKMKGRTGGKQWWPDASGDLPSRGKLFDKPGGANRTNVVNSGGTKPPARGAKMNEPTGTTGRRRDMARSAGSSRLPNSERTPTGQDQDPNTLAKNYVKMHGVKKAAEKLERMRASKKIDKRTLELMGAMAGAIRDGLSTQGKA